MNKVISLEIDNEEIAFADLTAREKLEIVAVCKSGNIFLFDIEANSYTFLAKLPFSAIPTLEKDFNLGESLNKLFDNTEDLQKASAKSKNPTRLKFQLSWIYP